MAKRDQPAEDEPGTDEAAERTFEAILTAALRESVDADGQFHPAVAPPVDPEVSARAQAAMLSAVRARPRRTLRAPRWLVVSAGLGGVAAAVLLAVTLYVVFDLADLRRASPYELPLDATTPVLVRPSVSGDDPVPLGGAPAPYELQLGERALRVGSVLVAPAGGSTVLGLDRCDLTLLASPGARMQVERGWPTRLRLQGGRVRVERRGQPLKGEGESVLGLGGASSGLRCHLTLQSVDAQVEVAVDVVGGRELAQVRVLRGTVTLSRARERRAVRLESAGTILVLDDTVLRVADAPASADLASDHEPFAGRHWSARSSSPWQLVPLSAARVPLELLHLHSTNPDGSANVEEAVAQLQLVAGAATAEDDSGELAAAAIETLGYLDSHRSLSALILLGHVPAAADESLVPLSQFNDPRSRSLLEHAMRGDKLAADLRARLALALARTPGALLHESEALERLAAEPTLSPRGRVDLAGARALRELAMGGELDLTELFRLLREGTPKVGLAALAILEELAHEGVADVAEGLIEALSVVPDDRCVSLEVALATILARAPDRLDADPEAARARQSAWLELAKR